MKRAFGVFLAVLTLAFLMPDTYAAGKSAPAKKKPAAQSTPGKTLPPHIEAISADSITVKNGTRTITYKITAFTSIQLNGMKAPVSSLKSGMPVTVEAGVDESVALTICAGHVE
ncbi:MAG: hypothetical protein NTZ46_08695 [Verrucomicrobia bacterium]|nr:hypothetical protein [Verrucomicrobiota bacterium]